METRLRSTLPPKCARPTNSPFEAVCARQCRPPAEFVLFATHSGRWPWRLDILSMTDFRTNEDIISAPLLPLCQKRQVQVLVISRERTRESVHRVQGSNITIAFTAFFEWLSNTIPITAPQPSRRRSPPSQGDGRHERPGRRHLLLTTPRALQGAVQEIARVHDNDLTIPQIHGRPWLRGTTR